jgi:hypothetical protein
VETGAVADPDERVRLVGDRLADRLRGSRHRHVVCGHDRLPREDGDSRPFTRVDADDRPAVVGAEDTERLVDTRGHVVCGGGDVVDAGWRGDLVLGGRHHHLRPLGERVTRLGGGERRGAVP